MAERKSKRKILAAIEADGPSVPSVAEARSISHSGSDRDAEGAGGLPASRTFTFETSDRRGRRWGGSFTTHVLTYRENIEMGVTMSALAGGVPIGSLPDETALLIEMISYLSIAVDDCPKWAENLERIRDTRVVAALYEEVASYEASFHGADAERARTGDRVDRQGDRRVALDAEDGQPPSEAG